MEHDSAPDEDSRDDLRRAELDDLDDDEQAEATLLPPKEVIALLAREGEPLPYDDLRSLSSPDDELVRALLPLWPAIGPERRREVLAALQRLCEDDPTLDFDRVHLTALANEDAATRILAIRGLWEHDREELIPVLTNMLQEDSQATVRVEAAVALGRFVVSLEFGMISEAIAEQLTDTLKDVIENLTEEDEVRASALESVGASSEEWVADLIADQYELGSARMRLAAVRAMGRHASDDWLPILLQTFEDEDEDVRAAAATSSGQLLMESAIDPLVLLIEADEEAVQVAAIGALGEISGQLAEKILTQLLERPEAFIVEAARKALAESRMTSIDFADAEPADDD